MSSIANLQRLPASELSKILLAEQEAATNPTIAVVDVRDDDRIGGHIKNSIHAPSNTLDAKMPTLVRQLADKKTVVFHCALSQQRGPSAAIKYVRERERMFPRRHKASTEDGGKEGEKQTEGSDILGKKATAGEGEEGKEEERVEEEEQKIYVLDQGFVGWQQVYADDERLTEGYRKEVWENGY
ncbi:hypothetical protein GE09DRAFT_1224860 [Coniochaeta sp. 2T2.1]|nr:hypothetical protein GE09DRAFT_1224860 [Coniochaeta sp. 2T2.1]